jgi:hypothetical protein
MTPKTVCGESQKAVHSTSNSNLLASDCHLLLSQALPPPIPARRQLVELERLTRAQIAMGKRRRGAGHGGPVQAAAFAALTSADPARAGISSEDPCDLRDWDRENNLNGLAVGGGRGPAAAAGLGDREAAAGDGDGFADGRLVEDLFRQYYAPVFY